MHRRSIGRMNDLRQFHVLLLQQLYGFSKGQIIGQALKVFESFI